jgi:diguanylate cyclase (GGDEF)-like protein
LNHRTRKIIRNPGEKIALLFIDLNKFKQVNTIHGHGTGDIVLKEIARIIHTHIREIDVAARIG